MIRQPNAEPGRVPAHVAVMIGSNRKLSFTSGKYPVLAAPIGIEFGRGFPPNRRFAFSCCEAEGHCYAPESMQHKYGEQTVGTGRLAIRPYLHHHSDEQSASSEASSISLDAHQQQKQGTVHTYLCTGLVRPPANSAVRLGNLNKP